MGLIGWVRDEEYVKQINAPNKFYQRQKRELAEIDDIGGVWKRWGDLFTNDELDIIRQWMQAMIDLTKKEVGYGINYWWCDFLDRLNYNCYINATESAELSCFFQNYEIYKFTREEEIEKKAYNYYMTVGSRENTEKLTDVIRKDKRVMHDVRTRQRKKEALRRWEEKNKEIRKEYHKSYYERHKKKCNENSKNYYKANREEVLAKAKERDKGHRLEKAERSRAYYYLNHEVMKAKARERQRKKSALQKQKQN